MLNVNKKAVQDAVHDWLSQVQTLDELINAKLAERDQVLAMATSTGTNMDGLPHGNGKTDKVGNAAVKLAQLAQEIDEAVDRYVDLKRSIVTELEKLPDAEYAVIHRRYIRYMTWEDIAKDMGYSTMQIWRYKVKAFERLYETCDGKLYCTCGTI